MNCTQENLNISIAGDPFSTNSPETRSQRERAGLPSAVEMIRAIKLELAGWQKKLPGSNIILGIQNPNGTVMIVQTLRAIGADIYVAEGHVDGTPSIIAAHISTLRVFCSLGENGNQERVGFEIALT